MANNQEKIEQNINEGISGSDGAFSLYYGDTYEELTPEEQDQVREVIEQEVQPCETCGWNWHVASMSHSEQAGGLICYKCEEDE